MVWYPVVKVSCSSTENGVDPRDRAKLSKSKCLGAGVCGMVEKGRRGKNRISDNKIDKKKAVCYITCTAVTTAV